jgi:succinyl-CoA synthetase beta subunit
MFRHKEYVDLRDLDEEDPLEVEASKFSLNYIKLDGTIACMVNGAGLAMATMDIIKYAGGEPANFLDVGGGATTENMTKALEIALRKPGVRALFINIFGGITRCDDIARAIVARPPRVPVAVRLTGTNEEEGRRILEAGGLHAFTDAEEAAREAVRLVGAPAR